jgi:hypothetical protein
VGGEEATVTVRILQEDAQKEGKAKEEKEERGKNNGKVSRDVNSMGRK